MTRFSEPLTAATKKVSFTPAPGMEQCLTEMAAARGVSKAELLRRVVAMAIVEDAPGALGRIAKRSRDEIEALAYLGGGV